MRAAGFDFGTSNSAIGIVKGNAATLARVEGDATMIPSAVFFDFADRDKPHYGRDAVEAYVTMKTAGLQARFDYNVAMAALSKGTGTLDGDSDVLYLAAPETSDAGPLRPSERKSSR